MRLVRRDNRLYEDYFDSIQVDDNPEEQVTVGDDDDVFHQETRQFAHSLNFVFVFHHINFIETLYKNLPAMVKRLEYVFDMNKYIERYAIRGLVMNPEHKDFKQNMFPAHEYRKEDGMVLDGDLQVTDPRPLLQSYVEKVRSSESKEDTVFEIELLFDVTDITSDAEYVAPLVVSLFALSTPVSKVLRNYSQAVYRNNMSMAFYLDGTSYRNKNYHYSRYYNNIEKACYQLLHFQKGYHKDDDRYIEMFIDKLQQQGMDSINIPYDILATIPNKSVEHIKPTHVQVSFRDDADGKKVLIVFPKNSTLTLNQLLIVWYYVVTYCAKHDDTYRPEVYVKCPLRIDNTNYIGKYGNWEDAIRECPTVICDRVRYFKIFEFLHEVSVERVVMNNPLNHQGRAENITGIVVNRNIWKNPDCEITSQTHDIEFRKIPENPNGWIFNARKK